MQSSSSLRDGLPLYSREYLPPRQLQSGISTENELPSLPAPSSPPMAECTSLLRQECRDSSLSPESLPEMARLSTVILFSRECIGHFYRTAER